MARHRTYSTRLFVDAPLDTDRVHLETERAHYLGRVLRCREGEEITVFNSRGSERRAVIESLAKRRPSLKLADAIEPLSEPEHRTWLLQALVKSDAMDLIVQKATELGVDRVIAVKTDFCVIKLDDERREKRLAHWQRIGLSACEQSGRHRPPEFSVHRNLAAAIDSLPEEMHRAALLPGSDRPVAEAIGPDGDVCLAIGPEGGFSPDEDELLELSGFTGCSFGPRILRADTAAITACAAVSLLRQKP